MALNSTNSNNWSVAINVLRPSFNLSVNCENRRCINLLQTIVYPWRLSVNQIHWNGCRRHLYLSRLLLFPKQAGTINDRSHVARSIWEQYNTSPASQFHRLTFLTQSNNPRNFRFDTVIRRWCCTELRANLAHTSARSDLKVSAPWGVSRRTSTINN